VGAPWRGGVSPEAEKGPPAEVKERAQGRPLSKIGRGRAAEADRCRGAKKRRAVEGPGVAARRGRAGTGAEKGFERAVKRAEADPRGVHHAAEPPARPQSAQERRAAGRLSGTEEEASQRTREVTSKKAQADADKRVRRRRASAPAEAEARGRGGNNRLAVRARVRDRGAGHAGHRRRPAREGRGGGSRSRSRRVEGEAVEEGPRCGRRSKLQAESERISGPRAEPSARKRPAGMRPRRRSRASAKKAAARGACGRPARPLPAWASE